MKSLAVEVYRVSGSLFFAAVGKLEALLDPLRPAAAIVILDLTQMLNIDTTGLEALENVHSLLSSKGSSLVLCGLQPQALSLLERSGFSARLGPHRIFQTLQAACQAQNT
jgi:sulfate permease, SulP family